MKRILLFICVAIAQIGFGQIQSLEIWEGSMNSANIPGPVQTTAAENLTATAGGNSGITVTGSFGDQQYTGIVIGSQPAISGLEFGIRDNSLSGTKSWQEDAVGVRFNSVGTPSSSYFISPTGAASGISTFSNGAFNISTNVPEALTNGVDAGDGLYYAGTITYTFNRPVDNPILHVTGLGAIFDAPELGTTLVWHTQYESTGGYTFTKLSGTSHTILGNGDTKIYNDWTTAQYESTGSYGTDGNTGGTGSFRVNGENITSFTMNVYVKGTASGESWNVTGDTETKVFNNDRHTQSWTVETFTFSGTVVVDDFANGSTQNEVDALGETAEQIPTGLYAVLVNDQGKVVALSSVATDGEFTFSGVLGDSYQVVLTTDGTVAEGDDAPTASLPDGWYNTEESFNPTTPNTSDSGTNGTTDAVTIGYNNINDVETGDLILGISQNTSVFPVKLEYFEVKSSGIDGKLTWITSMEENNSHFEVERSVDGKVFEVIGKVEGNGTTSREQEYGYTDRGIGKLYSEVYYRLKQVDYDGAYERSEIRVVNFEGKREEVSIYPNPVRGNLTVRVSGDEVYSTEIYDMLGKQVGVYRTSEIDMTVYQAGTYMVRVLDGSGKTLQVEKIVVLR